MSKGRMEAFSDGVLAIIITIMVLEMKVPHSAEWEALRELWPVFLSYVMSFAYLAIYWNNHHHMMQLATCVNGKILWANMLLLFCLSLIPFTTGWMGENHFAPAPTTAYGFVLFLAGISYLLLQAAIISEQGADSRLKRAVGRDFKGRLSALFYLLAIGCSFILPTVAIAIYVFVALMWIVPDSRIESHVRAAQKND